MKKRLVTYLISILAVFSVGNVWGYTEGEDNNFFGSYAGVNNTTGINNSFFGVYSGYLNTEGNANSFFGRGAGRNTTGSCNTFIGTLAGRDHTMGSFNVFLGYSAGYNETGSNKLYISNSDTSTPLIYGEFDNQYLEVNGDFNVNGTMSNNNYYQTQSNWPGFWLDELDDGQKGAFFVLDKGIVQMQRRGTGYGAYEGAPLRIAIMAPADTFNITSSGYVGIGTRNPSFPLQMASGAHVTTGGVWTNSSSRDYKENISSLSIENAQVALNELEPVTYNYKAESSEQYVGFIAEDVPELVAMGDRKSLSPMDIVAVLTKVVQEQQRSDEELKRKNQEHDAELKELRNQMKEQMEEMKELMKKNKQQESQIRQLQTALQFKQDRDEDLAQLDIGQVLMSN